MTCLQNSRKDLSSQNVLGAILEVTEVRQIYRQFEQNEQEGNEVKAVTKMTKDKEEKGKLTVAFQVCLLQLEEA